MFGLDFGAVRRIANLIDLHKILKMSTSISLQKSALIQLRTSSPKFAEASKRYPPPVINLALETSVRGTGRRGGRYSVPGRRNFVLVPARVGAGLGGGVGVAGGGRGGRGGTLVQRFDIEPFSDFSAK